MSSGDKDTDDEVYRCACAFLALCIGNERCEGADDGSCHWERQRPGQLPLGAAAARAVAGWEQEAAWLVAQQVQVPQGGSAPAVWQRIFLPLGREDNLLNRTKKRARVTASRSAFSRSQLLLHAGGFAVAAPGGAVARSNRGCVREHSAHKDISRCSQKRRAEGQCLRLICTSVKVRKSAAQHLSHEHLDMFSSRQAESCVIKVLSCKRPPLAPHISALCCRPSLSRLLLCSFWR